MIRTLMWKEYREHRAIWLTLAVGGGLCLVVLSYLMGTLWRLNDQAIREMLQSVSVLLAWTYGLICGAMLLANEQETGTMTFLDMQPVQRKELWWIKSLLGLLLFLAQVIVILSFDVGLGITETPQQLCLTLLAMLCFGLFAMSWSLLFSAGCENVLNVIGLSFLGQVGGVLIGAIGLGCLGVVSSLFGATKSAPIEWVLVVLVGLGLSVTPVAGSARLFTQLDRERERPRMARGGERTSLSEGSSWGRLLWLSYVQMRRFLIVILFVSLVLGCLLPIAGSLAWPSATLLLGVLCGIHVWMDEQQSASFRFLGDQRFPCGPMWIVKIGSRFLLALAGATVLLLPSLILASIRVEESPPEHRIPFSAQVFHSRLVGPIVPVGVHASLWLLYGFSAGQLCGMLFRKSLVAAVVALGTAVLFVCLWLPSLVGMDLHFWMIVGVPYSLLTAGILLMPAWTADRLLGRDSVVRLGSMLLLAALWTVGGLWYRVAEVPDVSEPFDVSAYVASIPPLDVAKNPAGMAIRTAWRQVDAFCRELTTQREGKALFPDLRNGDTNDNFSSEINAVLERGWPDRSSELGQWLDAKFKEGWHEQLREAANHPLGAVENSKQMVFSDRLSFNWWNASNLNRVLAIRGLQQQTRGNPQVYLETLHTGLAVSRNLQHRTAPVVIRAGSMAETNSLATIDRWLEKLKGHPELLDRARDILLEHEAEHPDETESDKASYLIAKNSLEMVPDKLIEIQLQNAARQAVQQNDKQTRAEINAAALLWRIPWEQERHQRILRLAIQDVMQGQEKGRNALIDFGVFPVKPRGKRDIALLHAAQLKVALRLFQTRNQGKLPPSLDKLVPHYLPAIPLDPFDGKPFRYRISVGEKLAWFDKASLAEQPTPGGMAASGPAMLGIAASPAAEPRKTVPAGQAILWSVGEDLRDDRGISQGINKHEKLFSQEDLIYLVPPPP